MNRILSSLFTLLAFTGMQAQPTAIPRLIVGLTVDQLRTDYLEAFSSLYGEKGFKKLWKEAMVIRNTQYNFATRDRASATASIYTGAAPFLNGIVGSTWFNSSTLRPIDCIDDASYMGNYTSECSSPARLLSSTLSDELEIFTQHKALVYAISPFRDAAVLSAGHAANGAFWINDDSGKWCSSTYYGDFPYWASNYNNGQAIDSRISGIIWTPLREVKRYTYLPDWRTLGFRHRFADEKQNKYRRFITSPYVNDEVNLFAEQVIKNASMGKDSVPDMLSLTYYAGNYDHKPIQGNALEMQDTYVRLDHSISSLLEMLDRYVGLQHVLFFITSTGYVDNDTTDPSSYHIPTGEFQMKRCTALLNMYLMAIYGNGQYVEGYYDNQIYLNHKLIEQKRLDLTEIQDKSASFLMQVSGINEAYSAHQILMGAWNPNLEKIRNGYNRLCSGDLYISILPGWTVIDNELNINKVIRNAYIPAPLILLGGDFKASVINTPVDIDRLAPTIASCLHIRAPNASTSTPLTNNQ